METKLVKDDLSLAFWLGASVNSESEVLYKVLKNIYEKSEEELIKMANAIEE